MNVWIRVAPDIEVDCETNQKRGTNGEFTLIPKLNLTVYPSQKDAGEAQKRLGGVVLEVNCACLRGQHEWEDVPLITEINEHAAAPNAIIAVNYDGLPHKMVPNYGGYEPGTVEPQGDIAEFSPEALAWLDKLEKETGFVMHQ